MVNRQLISSAVGVVLALVYFSLYLYADFYLEGMTTLVIDGINTTISVILADLTGNHHLFLWFPLNVMIGVFEWYVIGYFLTSIVFIIRNKIRHSKK